ncbi:MAG: translocation/assembly module TamB domain-containing protein [Nevskiaceae bacterium]
MTRRGKLALVLLGVLLLLPLGALWTLGHSSALVRALIARLPTTVGNIETLQITGVSGTIAGGLRIDRVLIQHDIVRVEARDVRARVELLPLLWQTVEVRDLEVRRIDITALPRDKPPPDKPPRFLPGLLSIDTREAKINEIEIQPQTGAPVTLQNNVVTGTLRSKTLRITEVATRLQRLQLRGEALLSADNPLDLEGRVRAVLQPLKGPRWVAEATANGNLEKMLVDATLTEPFKATIEDGSFRALLPWGLTGIARFEDLALERFGGSDFLGPLSGQLDLSIDRDGYRGKGRVLPPRLAAGSLEVSIDSLYSRGVLSLRNVTLATADRSLSAALEGSVTLRDAGPELALNGRWESFRWPLKPGPAVVTSPRGTLSINGLQPYRLDITARVLAGTLPPADVQARTVLNPGRLDILEAKAGVLRGTARLSGEVEWKPAERWRVRGLAQNIDPAGVRADLPGSLTFRLDARGSGFGKNGVVDLDVLNLTGQVRGTAARGQGSVRLSGDTLGLRKIDVAAGGLQLALDGSLSPRRRDLDFRIRANDLSILTPSGRGEIRAEGSVRGSPRSMLLKLDAQGRSIAVQGVEIGALEAKVDLDPSGGPQAQAVVKLKASDLSVAGQTADRLTLDVDGTSAAHALHLILRSDDLRLEGRAQGAFVAEGWQQRGSQLDVDIREALALGLAAPLEWLLRVDSGEVKPFCLNTRRADTVAGQATSCASGDWTAEGWKAALDITGLPLVSLLPRPSARANYEGVVNASAQLQSADEGLPYGSLRADFKDARLRWSRAGGKEEIVPLGSGSLEALSAESGVTARLDVGAGDRVRARGELSATRAGADWRGYPLNATLRAESSALGLLYLYIPEIDRSTGELSLDFVMGGTLGTPLVNGVMRVAMGELDFYQVNLALRDIEAEARLIDNGFVLKSSARSGSGRIDADAELTWRNQQPYGTLRIQGNDLTVVDIPEARITASPDLSFKVAARTLAATGTVLIPNARITPADLTGAVLPSADEIVISDEPDDPAASFSVSSNIRLLLGERVNIEALGLTGRLAGSLNVSTTPGNPARGSGELGVAEGKYMALGRKLDIERGRLIFSGGLVADPGIDIRATKEFPEFKAGVNVRGSLSEPRMTFFSEPSLPQSQVVSLLLAGGTLESAQSSDTANAGRDALLAQGGAILAQQLGQRIGIEDVGIEQNLANETSLVFGKYLSSRLYISYGISLAEAINTLKMRYSINDRWTLRTEAGKEASTDIVYTVEKN